MPAGQAIVGDAAEPCPACGAPAGECGCARVRDALLARAATLRRAGMRAARDGDLHRAISLLRRSAQIAPLEMDSARVLGLAALCLGETGIAAEAWRRADAPEMTLLADGPVRDALAAYNQALAAAQTGDAAAAVERVEQAHAAFPDLVPAHRLRALLAAEAGDAAGARAACEAGLAVCRDDAVLLRCFASATTAALATGAAAASLAAAASSASVSGAARGPFGSPSADAAATEEASASGENAAARPRSASPDRAVRAASLSRESGEERWRRGTAIPFPARLAWAASIALTIVVTRGLTERGESASGNPPAASNPATAGGARPAAPSPSPVTAGSPVPLPGPQATPAAAFDFAAYRRGRDAYGRGAWREAADDLSGAVAVPVDAYFRDDALYLLARAQGRIAARDEARKTAALLLRDYPESIFANRITRRIAAQGSE